MPTSTQLAPKFSAAVASWSSRPCFSGRCVLSCILPNVSTPGPASSKRCPGQPQGDSSETVRRLCEAEARSCRSAMESRCRPATATAMSFAESHPLIPGQDEHRIETRPVVRMTLAAVGYSRFTRWRKQAPKSRQDGSQDCQQKRQQRCTESAGSCNGGVRLIHLQNQALFEPRRRLRRPIPTLASNPNRLCDKDLRKSRWLSSSKSSRLFQRHSGIFFVEDRITPPVPTSGDILLRAYLLSKRRFS